MNENKFGLLRKMLRALGLSQTATDDVVNFISDLLAGEGKGQPGAASPDFPYHLRDNFLSPAELSFYGVLRTVVDSRATISAKVGLNDLFYVKREDPSRYRIYTNKIDRKHVDFLLCDPVTMRPIVGIELDDKSHERTDRKERDAFVDQVFQAAQLPLLHVPAKRGYVTSEIAALLAPYLNIPADPRPQKTITATDAAPSCPRCGNPMILRKAKKGSNVGEQFWGCSNYPDCRAMVSYRA
jgi:hypothetical protein